MEEKLAELKKRYGELYEIEYGEKKFYFRRPSRVEYKRYYDKLLESVYDSACILLLDTVIIPTRDELAKEIENDPSLPVRILPRLTDFFGSPVVNVRRL